MNNELINEDLLFAMSWKDKVLYLAAHRAEDELLRAFLRTKSEEEWWEEGLYDKEPSKNLDRAIGKVIWERYEFAHHQDIIEQPKYRPVKELLHDFQGTGNRQKARKEMQVRLRYLTAYEQKKILYAFMDSLAKIDRDFACKYLDKYYDPMYQLALETIWGLHHDFEAAKVVTHYASDEFIKAHFDELANDYRYLPVRLRMPADYPVDRSQLEWHELILLCARQHLSITEEEAFAILSNVIHLQLIRENVAFEGNSLLRLAYVSAVLWALGELGFQDLVLRFYVENERTKPLFRSGDKDAIAWEIREQIYHDGFCTSHNLGTKEDVEIRELFKRYKEHPEDFEE